MTNEREVWAVVAHGLLNSLAVVSGAAFTLSEHDGRLSGSQRAELLASLAASSEVLCDGLATMLVHCSAQFGDAATVVALAARVARLRPELADAEIMRGVAGHCKVLNSGLSSLVRGLPADVIEALERLGTRS